MKQDHSWNRDRPIKISLQLDLKTLNPGKELLETEILGSLDGRSGVIASSPNTNPLQTTHIYNGKTYPAMVLRL